MGVFVCLFGCLVGWLVSNLQGYVLEKHKTDQ